MTSKSNEETVIPLHVEDVLIAKRPTVTGRVKVSTVTRQSEVLVDEPLKQETVEVERAVVNRPIDQMPTVREEGEVLIIPVVEEVLVVERRLILKEEIRLRRIQQTGRHHEYLKIRKQEAIITRTPIEETPTEGLEPKEAESNSKEESWLSRK